MIRGYYEIAFVYGQSTFDIANTVKKNIENKYAKYPLRIKLCDDSIFRKAKGDVSIHNVVEKEFEGVKLAIIFWGKDMLSYSFSKDCFELPKNNTSLENIVAEDLFGNSLTVDKKDFVAWLNKKMHFTISQNAMFEMGYFWAKLKFDFIRIVPVFSKDDRLPRLPSNIPDNFLFYYNNGDSDFYDFIDKQITNVLSISSYNNVLYDTHYQVNYNELFTSKELDIIDSPRKNNAEQFRAISEIWKTQVQSLKEDFERLVFVYERLVFLSYFPYDEGHDSWLNAAIASIQNRDDLFFEILILIKTYIEIKSSEGKIQFNQSKVYQDVADRLYAIKNEFHKQNTGINPLVEIYLNDYLGIACRNAVEKESQHQKKPRFDITIYLKRSIEALERCTEIEYKLNSEASNFWRGYSAYNIARSYNLSGDYENAKNSMLEAYSVRKLWRKSCPIGSMPRVFEHSFKAEYILTAYKAIEYGCFAKDEINKIKSMCIEDVDSLISVKLEPIAIVETAIKTVYPTQQ